MKSSEIATIILIMVVSGAASFFLVSTLWGNPSEKTKDIQVMDAISKEFKNPSSEIFNENAINPTVTVEIGDDESKVHVGTDIEKTQN